MTRRYSPEFWKISLLTFLGLALVGCMSASLPTAATQPPATPAPATRAPVTSYITPMLPDAVMGEPVPAVPANPAWLTYANPVTGLSIGYPTGWNYVEQAGQLVVNFYPAGSDPQFPTGSIALIFVPDRPYTGQPLINTGGGSNPVNLLGIAGIQYQDVRLAVPSESDYIELPFHAGTLLITATLGPVQNLVPQMEEMLKTLDLSAGVSAAAPTATIEPAAPVPTSTNPPAPENLSFYADVNYLCLEGPAFSYPQAVDVYQGSTHTIIGQSGNNPGWLLLEIHQTNTHHTCCWTRGGVISGDLQTVPITEATCP
jgi:hypothetical protein